MPRARVACRVDDNQPELVRELRKLGLGVQSLASVGDGCPDIVVGYSRRNYLFEIKDPAKPPSRRTLTDDERKWHDRWPGQVALVETVDDVLRAIGCYLDRGTWMVTQEYCEACGEHRVKKP